MESKRSLMLQWIEQGELKKEQAEEALSAVGVLPDGLRWRIFLLGRTCQSVSKCALWTIQG